jgi:hypothetical protein
MLLRILRVALPAIALAFAAFAADISGAWEFTVETSQGSGTPSFEFKQEGDKLSGTYSGRFGKAPLAGSVKGDQVDFTFEVAERRRESTLQGHGGESNAHEGRCGIRRCGKGNLYREKEIGAAVYKSRKFTSIVACTDTG